MSDVVYSVLYISIHREDLYPAGNLSALKLAKSEPGKAPVLTLTFLGQRFGSFISFDFSFFLCAIFYVLCLISYFDHDF